MTKVDPIQPKQQSLAKRGAKIGSLSAIGLFAGGNLSAYLKDKHAYKDLFETALIGAPKKAKPFIIASSIVIVGACIAAIGSLLGAGIGKITEITKNKIDSKKEAEKKLNQMKYECLMHQG